VILDLFPCIYEWGFVPLGVMSKWGYVWMGLYPRRFFQFQWNYVLVFFQVRLCPFMYSCLH